jgi:hypothetical protein
MTEKMRSKGKSKNIHDSAQHMERNFTWPASRIHVDSTIGWDAKEVKRELVDRINYPFFGEGASIHSKHGVAYPEL